VIPVIAGSAVAGLLLRLGGAALHGGT